MLSPFSIDHVRLPSISWPSRSMHLPSRIPEKCDYSMTLMLQTVTKQIVFPSQRAHDDRGLWEGSSKHQKVGSSFRISSTEDRRMSTTATMYRTVRLERKRSSERPEKAERKRGTVRHSFRRASHRQVAGSKVGIPTVARMGPVLWLARSSALSWFDVPSHTI